MAYTVMQPKPLHTVVETAEFRRIAGRLLGSRQREALIDYLAANPDAGEPMVGTGGARKLRWSGRGRGKSGGVRVITFFSGPPVPVLLLSAFAKGQKISLTDAEKNKLRNPLGELVDEYRSGETGRVEGR